LASDLVAWYRANARPLPWRATSDPYAIWVSEVMLQQTQVATVVPFFEHFLNRFPSLKSLAAASEEDVLAAWQGLGYYKRARSLLAAAKILRSNPIPETHEELARLPGVGRYTSRAIASIAFGQRTAVADANVVRALSRHAGRALTVPEAERVSLERMAGDTPGEWNQALMELGATVCLPKQPRCGQCPLATSCEAKRTGDFDGPIRKAQTTRRCEEHVCVCPRDGERVGMRKIPPGEWWESMWEFPRVRLAPGEAVEAGLRRLGCPSAQKLGAIRHSVTNHSVTLHAYTANSALGGVEWFSLDEVEKLPLPSPQRRVARMLAELPW
jgi:A/G-specific adenine glycosylase